jgi:hypothetical protein
MEGTAVKKWHKRKNTADPLLENLQNWAERGESDMD